MAELFDDPVTAVASLPPIDPNKNYLEELVGEGKAYKDPVALARAAMEKERHIQRLEAEQKALRQDLNNRLSLDQLVDKMAAQTNRQVPSPAPKEEDGTNPNASIDTSKQLTLTPEALQKLVDERLNAATERSNAERNLNEVKTTLKAAWGDQWVDKLKAEGAKIGLNQDWMNSLAASQPKALLQLVNAQAPQSAVKDTGAPPRGTVNVQATQSDPNFRGKSFYNKMRTDNPTAFWSEKTQIEMNNMAMKDPEKFLAS